MSSYSGATVTLPPPVWGHGEGIGWDQQSLASRGSEAPGEDELQDRGDSVGGVRTTDVCQEERQNAEFQSSSESRVLQGEISRQSGSTVWVNFVDPACDAACTDDKPPDLRNYLY